MRSTLTLRALAFLCGAVLLGAGTAAAQDGPPGRDGGGDWRDKDPDEKGGSKDGGIFSEVEYSNSRDDAEAPAAAQPVGGWEPPACWYEPRTAQEIRGFVEGKLEDWTQLPDEDIDRTRTRMTQHYRDGSPYTNYNLAVADDGSFWVGVANPQRLDDPAARGCSPYGRWAEHGEPPPVGDLAVTPRMLAEAAYEWLPLPEVDVELNPDASAEQVVNLAIWVWQDSGLEEVSATASLERLGLSVTTTATPVSLTLDPAAADASTHPGDGRCAIRADGSVGQPWAPSLEGRDPPCGVTYHRASPGTELTATVTWNVSWTGTGQTTPEPLPQAEMTTTHTLTVNEVQTIVR